MGDVDGKVLEFIGVFVDEHGYPPTYRQIALAAEVSSTSSVHKAVKRLVRSGHLEMTAGVGRSLRLVRP